MKTYGISSLGLAFPLTAITMNEFARLRKAEPAKYLSGLGCREMAISADGSTTLSLGFSAAQKALSRWKGSLSDIGMLVVGTESGIDFSRPLSSWIAQDLGLSGNVRSYEVKHACLGGTLALRQALEWKMSGTSKGKAALVVAADVALYAPASPGEPTQGAGAIAMIIDTPDIAVIEPESYSWSTPAFDFWRPVDEEYPRVDGPLSLKRYMEAARFCFGAHSAFSAPEKMFEAFKALCFHVPFPKITFKTIRDLGNLWGFTPDETEKIYLEKIEPWLHYNRLIGNCYTASLWLSVAHALSSMKKGESLLAFSYGSGCGAELLGLRRQGSDCDWMEDLDFLIEHRRYLTAEQYNAWRKGYPENYLVPAA